MIKIFINHEKPSCFGKADPYDAQCHWKPNPCSHVKECKAKYDSARVCCEEEKEIGNCVATNCVKKAVVILTVNGVKEPFCPQHWKEHYD